MSEQTTLAGPEWVVVWLRSGREWYASVITDWSPEMTEFVCRFPTREEAEAFRVTYTWEPDTFVAPSFGG